MNRRALLGVAVLAFWPSPAHAEGFLLTYGETIRHVGEARNSRPAVGYRYYYFGVCGIDLWTWDGTYCLYRNDHYSELTPELAADRLNKSPSDLREPFLFRCPPGLLILLLVVAGLLLRDALKKSSGRKLYALLKEQRYLKALAIFHDHAHAPPDCTPVAVSEAIIAARQAGAAVVSTPNEEGRERARQAAGFHAALEYLASQGVEPEKAGPKLAALLSRPHRSAQAG